MANPIKHSDIIQDDVFKPTIDEAKELVKQLKTVEKLFGDILVTSAQVSKTTPLTGYDNIKQLTDALKAAKVAAEVLANTEKERVKTEKELAELELEQAKALKIKAKAEKESADAAELSYKTAQRQEDAYTKLSKELNQARKAYKDLAAQNKETSKEAQDLLTKIGGLDKRLKDIDASVGQFQRNVGNYESGFAKIKTTFLGWFAAIGGAMGIWEGFKKVMDSTAATADKLEAAMAGVSSATSAMFASIANGDWSNLIDNMTTAYEVGVKYAEALDDITDSTNAQAVISAQTREKIAQLDIAWRDTSKTLSERKALLTEMLRIEKQNADAAIRFAKETAQAEQDRLVKLTKLNGKQLQWYIKVLAQNPKIIEQGNEILEQEKQLEEMKGSHIVTTGRYSTVVQNATLAEIKQQEKIIENLKKDARAREFATIKKQLETKTNQAYFDSYEKSLISLYEAQAAFDENTRKAQVKLNELNNAAGKANQEAKAKRIKSERERDQAEMEKLTVVIKEANVERIKDDNRVADLRIRNEIKTDARIAELNRQNNAQMFSDAVELLDEYLKARNERIVKAADEAIEQTKKQQDRLAALAQKGVEDAANNLAFEQRKQAQLELQKERTLKRQQRNELLFGALKTYSSKVEAGDKNALGSTIKDITLLSQLVRSLPSYFEGTEDTGDGGGIDGKGGFHAVLHPHERVMTAEQNKLVDGLTNWQLASIGALYKNKQIDAVSSLNDRFASHEMLIQKFDEMKQAFENKPTYLGRDYDATKTAIVETIQRANKIERNHKKSSAIW